MGKKSTNNELLHVRLRPQGKHVTLDELREVARNLQRVLTSLGENLCESEHCDIAYEITNASVGSLVLALKPVASDATPIEPTEVLRTFTSDLNDIGDQKFRPTMTTELSREYLALVRTLGGSDSIVEYSFEQNRVHIDPAFRGSFEVALKERVTKDAVVIGSLDAITVHKRYVFYLYPKLERSGRIECRFPTEMLDHIAGLIEHTVEVRGSGHYGPVGLYPSKIDVSSLPRVLSCDEELLRSSVGKMKLVPKGMTAAQYLVKNREAAGLGS